MATRKWNWAEWTFAIIGTALAPLGFVLFFADAWVAFAALVLGFFGTRAAVLHWLKAREARRIGEAP